MSKKLKCVSYMECSAKTMEGVAAVFEQAVKAVICPKSKEHHKNCKIL